MNLDDLLTNIESLAEKAREAIADEHEGNLKLALNLLEDNAIKAAKLVNNW